MFGFLIEEEAVSELLCGLLEWEASEKAAEVLSVVLTLREASNHTSSRVTAHL